MSIGCIGVDGTLFRQKRKPARGRPRLRIQSGDYVMGKDARGQEWAGFFERVDAFHAQTSFVWVHVGWGYAELRPLLTDTIVERVFQAPHMSRMRWEFDLGARKGVPQLRAHWEAA